MDSMDPMGNLTVLTSDLYPAANPFFSVRKTQKKRGPLFPLTFSASLPKGPWRGKVWLICIHSHIWDIGCENIWLVGGWATYLSEKYEFVSWD